MTKGKTTKGVSKEILEFIILMTKEYVFTQEELTEVWIKYLEEKEKMKQEENEDDYSNLKRPALVDVCKQMNLKSGGTKKDLIERIENEKKIKKLIHIENPMRTVLMNANGNYVDTKTSFCFDPYTKRVIGKEVDGEIVQLTLEDVEFCKENHYRYVIPETFK
jgi:hypothetical protein